MVIRSVYTKAEEKMIAEYEAKSDRLVGWMGDTPSEEVPYPVLHRVASEDLIRHMAYAADYKNPLWRDKNYARNTRWGDIIAPPFFLYTITHGGSFFHLNVTPEVGTLVGLILGEEWEFFKPIYVNDSFKVWVSPRTWQDITRDGEAAERRFKTVADITYFNQRDEIVGIKHKIDIDTILPPGVEVGEEFRSGAEMGSMDKTFYTKFKQTEEYIYTQEDIEAIDRAYDSEERRGSKILYWEDVNIGDELPMVVMGPITPWDSVVEMQGFGIAMLPTMEVRRQTPDRIMIDPVTNIPRKGIEIHLSHNAPRMENIYSTTLIQLTIEHFLSRMMTNWMGDDGFIRKFHWFKMVNTPLGDTIFGHGKVTGKYVKNGEYLVDIDTWLETVRGYVSNTCPATVKLVSKKTII